MWLPMEEETNYNLTHICVIGMDLVYQQNFIGKAQQT